MYKVYRSAAVFSIVKSERRKKSSTSDEQRFRTIDQINQPCTLHWDRRWQGNKKVHEFRTRNRAIYKIPHYNDL